jgi:hypothetical protein
MVETQLVTVKIEDAAELLQELDRQKFPVDAMFWINRHELPWRLIVGTSFVAEHGPLAGYGWLGKIFNKFDFFGLEEEDISLFDPTREPFRSMRSEASHSTRVARGKQWVQYEDAVVYRWNNTHATAHIDCAVTLDDLTRLWNAERKRSNQPLLLLDLDGQTLTLRLHPQQGDIEDIEDVKSSFQNAFAEARPDCKLDWFD